MLRTAFDTTHLWAANVYLCLHDAAY